MHLWSDLGKIRFSPSLVGKITFLMSQRITRKNYLSNELSWAQFGVEECIQKLTAIALCLEAASFGTFWPVLGDLIFDRETELQIEKFQLSWKLYSKTFPTSYPAPDFDTGKTSKSLLQNVTRWAWRATHQRRATHQAAFSSEKFTQVRPVSGARPVGWGARPISALLTKPTANLSKDPQKLPNCLR